jgi:RNA polymerase sigma-70 factor (ECF subfamily)
MPATVVQNCSNAVAGRAEAPPAHRRSLMRVDEVSFDSFFRRFYPLALNYLYRRLGDRELAEEVVESAFVRLVPAAPKVEVSHCTSWVYRVVMNELRRHRRSEEARGRLYERFQEWRRGRLTRQAPPPGEALDFESVRAAMTRLDDKYSTVLSLCYFEHLCSADIASIVNASESTVRTRLRRGLEQLRAQLGVQPRQTWRRPPVADV